jgi:TetR/AcrR family fatty acid metabolism transcriptional regulator
VTVYEYFESKEDVVFSIAELYTRRELELMKAIEPYIYGAREKMRVIIQGFLEFYETYPLYTSVVLLTLKGNRNFLKSPAYATIRETTRSIVDAFDQGVEEGIFRNDIDGYLVRNLVLGFIEHLAAQWLPLGRPERISDHRDTIFDMVMRAIERREDQEVMELKLKIEGANVPFADRRSP